MRKCKEKREQWACLMLRLIHCNPLCSLPAAVAPEKAHRLPASFVSSDGHWTPLNPLLWPGQLGTTIGRGNFFLTPCSEIRFLPGSVKTEVLIIFITAS